MANTSCGVPLDFANTLVGGLSHGQVVPPQHGIRIVETIDHGFYQPLGFANRSENWKIYIWFHEGIRDSQALLWVNNSVYLEDIEKPEAESSRRANSTFC